MEQLLFLNLKMKCDYFSHLKQTMQLNKQWLLRRTVKHYCWNLKIYCINLCVCKQQYCLSFLRSNFFARCERNWTNNSYKSVKSRALSQWLMKNTNMKTRKLHKVWKLWSCHFLEKENPKFNIHTKCKCWSKFSSPLSFDSFAGEYVNNSQHI